MLRKIRNFFFFASLVLAAALVATEDTSIPEGVWVGIFLLIPPSVLLVIIAQSAIPIKENKRSEKARRLDMRLAARRFEGSPVGGLDNTYYDPSSVEHRY